MEKYLKIQILTSQDDVLGRATIKVSLNFVHLRKGFYEKKKTLGNFIQGHRNRKMIFQSLNIFVQALLSNISIIFLWCFYKIV